MKKILTFLLVVFSITLMATFKTEIKASEKSYVELDSNLFVDGGFENFSLENMGKWQIKVGSQDSQRPGVIELDTYTGYNGGTSLTLKTSASSGDYPEIWQVIEVEKNTDYYFSFRLRNNMLAMTTSNLFFGFASESYETGVDYVQQHRWSDTSTSHSYEPVNEEFTLVSGTFNSGNRTSLRAFLRLGKMNVTIDEMYLTKYAGIVPFGAENLLKYPGFEGTDTENNSVWVYENSTEGRNLFGYDDVRSTDVYTPGVDIQDKQKEGFRNVFFGSTAGAKATYPMIYQSVEVEKNQTYTFYVHLTGWNTLWGAWVGIMDEAGNDINNAWTWIEWGDFSNARYLEASVTTNVGENTVVRPYVKAYLGPTSGEWGSGIQADDFYFFKDNGTPEQKTELLKGGNFTSTSDWQMVGPSGEASIVGYDQNNNDRHGYTSTNIAYIKHWADEKVGISQTVELTKDKLYKLDARIQNMANQIKKLEVEGDPSSEYLYGHDQFLAPVVLQVLDGGNVIYQKEIKIDHNVSFALYDIIFEAPASKEYEIFIGFLKGANYNWRGAIAIGNVSLYNVLLEEVTPKEEDPADYIYVLDNKITLEEDAITILEVLTKEEFLAGFQLTGSYTLKIYDGEAELEDGKNVYNGYTVKLFDADEKEAKIYSVNAPNAPVVDNDDDADKDSDLQPWVIWTLAGSGAVLLGAAGFYIYYQFGRKKK